MDCKGSLGVISSHGTGVIISNQEYENRYLEVKIGGIFIIFCKQLSVLVNSDIINGFSDSFPFQKCILDTL